VRSDRHQNSTGKKEPLRDKPASYGTSNPRLSPDGKRITLQIAGEQVPTFGSTILHQERRRSDAGSLTVDCCVGVLAATGTLFVLGLVSLVGYRAVWPSQQPCLLRWNRSRSRRFPERSECVDRGVLRRRAACCLPADSPCLAPVAQPGNHNTRLKS
jgi:hypothetical protein